MMSEDGKIKIEKFEGQDFAWWKMQVEDLLCQKDLLQVLTGDKTEKVNDDEWADMDRKALAVIRCTLAKSVAFNIVKETTAKGLMKALSNMYEKPSASNKVFLIRQLVNTRMKEGASVAAHVNDFNNLISRLLSVDIEFDDEVQALLLLSSLPESWSGFVTAISSSSGSTKLKFDGIRDSILGEDIRRRSTGESSSVLLNTEGRSRKKERSNYRGRSKSRGRRGNSKVRKERTDIKCWNCNENGHFRSQCTKPPVDKNELHSATVSDSDDALICCVEDEIEAWIMDSGASFHAIWSSRRMKNLRLGNFGKVKLANNKLLDVTGMGDIDLKTSLGTVWTLKNVRLIPELKRMLISVGQLDDQGYGVYFGGGQWRVVKGSMVIAKGKKRGSLYMVEVPAGSANAVSRVPSPSKLWHQRLGHMSEKGMKMLVARGKLPELKKVESEFCEPCVLGKKKKVSFAKTGKAPKSQKLELVHTDVYGPTPVASLGGSHYYVTFIDDSTRKDEGKESQADSVFMQLKEAVAAYPDDPSAHFNLGLLFWKRIGEEAKEKAAEHFVIAAKLNPQDANAFRYLGHYYSKVSVDKQRALKCYQRALTLSPQDSESGESMCDLLDKEGKESLEIAVCREASGKSPRAFWAFRRLGFLQVHQKKWSEAVQSLQQAIRGYPTSADLWEALGLAYQRLSMFTAAIKSYARAIELEESRVFALIESGYVFLMLGSHRKGVEQFQKALQISSENVAAHYGLGCGLLELSKECISSGAFKWGASILEEASNVTNTGTCLAKNVSSMWKLHGDIQLTYAKCFPWMDEDIILETNEKALTASIYSWINTCSSAALCARRSYQQALHLAPWQANIYTDIAITIDVINSFKEEENHDLIQRKLPEKMILGGLLLESYNNEFWVALGCLSHHVELKQHAFIRSLQLDVSLAAAWAYLGKLYRKQGEKKLAQDAFDRARSIDPSLALPWAGMSADMSIREIKADEAYDCCLRAVQILPLPEFQMGLAKLALLSGQLSSSEVFGPIRQALHHAPQYPECHNLLGLVCEARCDYLSAITSYRLARCAVNTSSRDTQKLLDISLNLARTCCKAGRAYEAVQICEELKKKGVLDWEGLHIYALSSWQLGKNDQALSVVRILAASVKSLEPKLASTSISFICRMLYYISGREAVMASILKMPTDLFKSSKVSFVVSAIHILAQSNQLEQVVANSRSSLSNHDEITGMHFLITLSKLVKSGSEDRLGVQNGINHLTKTLHKYPNSYLLRNFLGYLLICSNEQKDTHLSTRCFTVRNTPSECPKEEGLRRAPEILGASAVACYTTGNLNDKYSFPTCKDQSTHQHGSLKLMQRWCHQEPWNKNARYLLILNYIQKAREERYPQHICMGLERLTNLALSDEFREYQKFQLSLCASEISLQSGNQVASVNHAKSASKLSLPDGYLFFSHLQLCRAYAAEDNRDLLREEYMRCLDLRTDYHIGFICLKYIECFYELQTDGNIIELMFEECSKDIKYSWNIWKAISKLVQGLIAAWNQDFLGAEELFAHACSLNGSESCLFLCHGAVCMELARQQCNSDYLLLAVGSLKKARDVSLSPIPILQLLLAQAEASLGYKGQWEHYLKLEWSSWPPEMRPAEIFLQMHLLLKSSEDGRMKQYQKNPLRWILQAIHMNPSCSRYWKALQNS